ncbi:MAG TPA: helix-turn-helix domain-containing protein [Candidatus Baltobacteraceae bacterium]|nr:helix-turn-helix domain-containing protein [Candidatus Baltobacteraceae bacterium]
MADIVERVAQALASKRAQLGISLEEAARRANIDAAELAAAENAETALDENELQRLADAYGIDVTAFFGGRITPKEYLFGA